MSLSQQLLLVGTFRTRTTFGMAKISRDDSKKTRTRFKAIRVDTARLEQEQLLEEQFLERMAKIQTKSRRLEKARINPKAKAFFKRPPNSRQGYDQMWVAAIDNVCFKSLVGNFRNYGIEFADNFGDFQDACAEDGLFSIEGRFLSILHLLLLFLRLNTSSIIDLACLPLKTWRRTRLGQCSTSRVCHVSPLGLLLKLNPYPRQLN
jgi:hypothetical protein